MKEEFKDIEDMINDDETYDIVTLTDDDGNSIDFFVIDGIEHNGINYLLVVECSKYDDSDAETEACILKETSADENDCIYEFVEDDEEYNKIAVLLQREDSDYEMKFDK